MAEVIRKTMEAWRKCWRQGFAPQISRSSLVALREQLSGDHRQLTQGMTTWPISNGPLPVPVEKACAVGFCEWRDGAESVQEVDVRFAQVCFEADKLLGETGGCRYFLNFWDESKWPDLKEQFLPELDLAIASKES